MKKASDYFKVVSLKGNKLTVEFTLEQPTESNLSQTTGKTHVLGRAFGKLNIRVNGTPLKIQANIMLPVAASEKVSEMVDVDFTPAHPPVIPPPASTEQPQA